MAPTAYVAENGLIGHQWKEKLLSQPKLSPSVWECQGVLGKGAVGEGNTFI